MELSELLTTPCGRDYYHPERNCWKFFTYTGLRDNAKVDGKPATTQTAVISSTLGIPNWVSVDKHTWVISGTPPESARWTNFTITIRDTHSDALNLTVSLKVANNIDSWFSSDLPKLTITAGKPFSFNLRPYLRDPLKTDISADVDPSSPWIKFDAGTATLFGKAPDKLGNPTVVVKIKSRIKGFKGVNFFGCGHTDSVWLGRIGGSTNLRFHTTRATPYQVSWWPTLAGR
ncbi:hypothetical protein VTI74DRAFT_6364 [Chaetomium olivicolor]